MNHQPEFLEKLGKHYAQSPMAAADIVSNLGDVSALSMERHELLESRFSREVLKPFGLPDIIWFPALRTGGRMASMHASRSEKAPHYQQLEISLFKLLSPHVCRSLAISDALDIRALRSEMLEKTLDMLAAGVGDYQSLPGSATNDISQGADNRRRCWLPARRTNGDPRRLVGLVVVTVVRFGRSAR
jgi:hypothetical protein